mgnify:CR=1 FL=1
MWKSLSTSASFPERPACHERCARHDCHRHRAVHVFRTGGAGKYDGTVHEGIEMFLVGYLLQSDLHRQVQRDFVSGFPFAANRQVLARLGVISCTLPLTETLAPFAHEG